MGLFNRMSNPVLNCGKLGRDKNEVLWEFAMKTNGEDARFSFLDAGDRRDRIARQLERDGYLEKLFVSPGKSVNISGDLTQKAIDYINECIFPEY